LALGHVLRNKANIKEKERQSMKCAEGTQTEEGTKWLKKQKRRIEVKEKKVVKREYQGRQSFKEYESWKGQQVEEDTNRCFGAPHREEGRIGWRSP
jgi:hypothetical protein